MLEESRERIVEQSRLLHVRHVAGGLDDGELGAGDVLVHLLAEGRRRDRVLVPDENLNRR